MKNIIIDCDPGHDDIMAILSAIGNSEQLNILGFATVSGNQTVDKVTNNLLKVLTYLHLTYPVAKGYADPMIRPSEPQPLAHGESGLDGPILPDASFDISYSNAIEFYKEMLTANEKVTIVALAPLTNIAMFIKTYPELLPNIERIVLMGGAINTGNIVEKAEFNMYHDPEAAKIVFESGLDIVMAPLEVCYEASVEHSIIDDLKGKGYVSQLSYEILNFFSQYNRKKNIAKSPIFDLVPVMYLLHPEIFKIKKCPVSIETEGHATRGMSVVDDRGIKDNNINIIMHVNQEKFVRYFLDDISKLDRIYRAHF